ncbi:NAD(P)H-dependent oxidoreductase [Bradyrhizobium sp. CB82]|uniref:NAD(P)H-dependent oxidoreductase n=1 Tax=Bradyrhizobium sp. CB82 TaxID=3039159 RepID=UPI0024B1E902|nr:NAD(P)H-dependent oxidoreductase [Bradyrhizobium sp. CB82]WFU43632.1 NAD(P)H-dependent oxidoreductase [Bradyrhizobium sp. CB82]
MNILHIDSSSRPKSHSRELSAAIVKKLLQVAPDASIRRRDLGADPLPLPRLTTRIRCHRRPHWRRR